MGLLTRPVFDTRTGRAIGEYTLPEQRKPGKILWIDTETYSETPIKRGTDAYMADPSFEIMLFTWAIGDGPVRLWDLTASDRCPNELEDALLDTAHYRIGAHNSTFDRTALNRHRILHPDVDLSVERWMCTMVQAYAHGLPGGLDKLCDIFGIDQAEAKDKSGKQLIHLFCKPNRGKRATPATHPDQWDRFCEYACKDISSMRAVHNKLPKWNYPGAKFVSEWVQSDDHKLWCRSQRINERGFQIDSHLAEKAIECAAEEKELLDAKTNHATDGTVTAATQRDKMLAFILESHGVTLPDMKADTLKRRIEDENLPVAVRYLLDLRLQSAKNSSSKYLRAIESSIDDRIRFSLQFMGAPATGRDAGRLYQPHNMMRPTMEYDDILDAITAVKRGYANLLYPNVPEVLGNLTRGVIVAAPGKKLVACDLSAIEGRGLAYLARDERVVQFYRDYDAKKIGYDSYLLAYAQTFGEDPTHMTKKTHGEERLLGKPIELSLGYGGGVSAFVTFAMVYHIDLEEVAEKVWRVGDQEKLRECEAKYEWAKKNRYHAGLDQRTYAAFEYIKQGWRAARQPTVEWWELLADGFRNATLYPERTFHARSVAFRRDGSWLRMRLPSGRCLCFVHPRVDSKGLSFMGLDRYTRRLGRIYTHGGKIAGWATQAFARDILYHSIPRIEEAGYPVVLGVHDELVTEPDDNEEFSPEGLAELFTAEHDWCAGLPLAADGFEAYRYRK